MPQRKKRAGRCDGCGLHLALCVCDRFAKVQSTAALVVVRHNRERFKPTNTGRWLEVMIPGTVITHYGHRDPPFDASSLERPDVRFCVLYPREDATMLDEDGLAQLRAALTPGQRLGFVLLDGTWHQCSRMSRRVPVVQDLPCVALPPGPPSRWGVRTQHDERGMSTFEAGVRLVSLVDGPARAAPLQAIFHEIAARMMFMKGKLPRPEVPAEWHDDVLPDGRPAPPDARSSDGPAMASPDARLDDEPSDGPAMASPDARLDDEPSDGPAMASPDVRLDDERSEGRATASPDAQLNDESSDSPATASPDARFDDEPSDGPAMGSRSPDARPSEAPPADVPEAQPGEGS